MSDEIVEKPEMAPQIKHKILIVDDNPQNRDILEEHISYLGYTPLKAENGQIGLSLLEREKPDLILLDILMPKMNGYELLNAIKSNPGSKNIPVIVISAVDEVGSVMTCIGKGADDYLYKPVNFDLLQVRITSCLEKKRAKDLEERGKVELEEARGIIAQKNKEVCLAHGLLNKYMRICSHELKNKLLAVTGYSDLLLHQVEEREFLNEEMMDWIKIISDSASYMNSILKDSLDNHQILSERIIMEITPLDLNQLIRETFLSYNILAENKDISVQTHFSEKLPLVDGDRLRMAQVIGNYFTNAVKFSPNGTSVRARTFVVNQNVRFEIEDEGPGVAPEARKLLFKDFTAPSTKAKVEDQNPGIGLTIVKKLIEAQKGNFGVKFPTKNGAIFWCELPISEQKHG